MRWTDYADTHVLPSVRSFFRNYLRVALSIRERMLRDPPARQVETDGRVKGKQSLRGLGRIVPQHLYPRPRSRPCPCHTHLHPFPHRRQ